MGRSGDLRNFLACSVVEVSADFGRSILLKIARGRSQTLPRGSCTLSTWKVTGWNSRHCRRFCCPTRTPRSARRPAPLASISGAGAGTLSGILGTFNQHFGDTPVRIRRLPAATGNRDHRFRRRRRLRSPQFVACWAFSHGDVHRVDQRVLHVAAGDHGPSRRSATYPMTWWRSSGGGSAPPVSARRRGPRSCRPRLALGSGLPACVVSACRLLYPIDTGRSAAGTADQRARCLASASCGVPRHTGELAPHSRCPRLPAAASKERWALMSTGNGCPNGASRSCNEAIAFKVPRSAFLQHQKDEEDCG